MDDTERYTQNHQPVISIIVASLNSSQNILRCLKSIWAQTYQPKELIVMDGGSTDGSAEIFKANQDKIAYWESRPDRGIYHAWNKALDHANGEWICFLGADDYFWKADVLEKLVHHLIKAEKLNIGVVYGKIAKLNSKGQVLTIAGKPWKKIRWQMSHGMPSSLPHPGLMHHRRLFRNHGLFDESYKIAGDYEFLLRELKNNQALYADSLITVGFQVGGIADSSPFLGHGEAARARRKNGLHRLSWVWTMVYMRAIFRNLWRKNP